MRRLEKEHEDELRGLIKTAVQRHHHLLTYVLARAMFDSLENVSGEQSEWITIESLSVLRKIIGGRFALLREKWVKAGLPLREKKGDRTDAGNISSEGWSALSEWLLDRGYDSRLSESGLFEIRARSRRSI